MKVHSHDIGLNLNTKNHTKLGISSLCLGVGAIIALLSAIWISAVGDRSIVLTQYLIGAIEALSGALSVTGISFGIAGELRGDTIKKTAHIGIVMNSFLVFLHIIIFISGY